MADEQELAELRSRLDVLEQERPKNSLRIKHTDGHHHMEPTRLLEDGTDRGFGFELDFKNSTVTRGTLAENRKVIFVCLYGAPPQAHGRRDREH